MISPLYKLLSITIVNSALDSLSVPMGSMRIRHNDLFICHKQLPYCITMRHVMQAFFQKSYKNENCKLFLQLFQKTFYLISIYKSYSKNAYFLLFRNIIARQKDWHNVSLKTNIKLLYFKSDIAFLLCIGH